MIDCFKELIAQSSFLSVMVDNARTVEGPGEWCIGYLYDGYLDCAVIFDGSRYYDVQDINLKEHDFGEWQKFSHYESLEALVWRMEEVALSYD